MNRITFIILTLSISAVGVKSQDIHFSQFSQTPLIINPANTGFSGADHRAIINYKDQWRTIALPYKTYALSYDISLMKNKWKSSYLGAGFTVFNDNAGEQLGITQVNLSVASIVKINDQQKISAGLQGGFAQKSMDLTKIETGNQFNGVYDPSLPTGETDNFDATTFGDFSAGIAWGFQKITGGGGESSIGNFKVRAGVAIFHINKPRQELYAVITDKLYPKIAFHTSAWVGLKNLNLALLPSVLILKQGPAQEILFGTMVRYTIKKEAGIGNLIKETAVQVGGHYRLGDAFIPSFVIEFNSFALGISYDINTSNLKTVSSGQGGLEISLKYLKPSPFKSAKSKRKSLL